MKGPLRPSAGIQSQRLIFQFVRANSSGCLDNCALGPSVVVYPEGVWYGHVRPEDVPEIVESHLVNGVPVERLRLKKFD